MNPDFIQIFDALKSILKEYEKELIVKHDTENSYYLNSPHDPARPGEEGFFGAAQIKKNYVSFHLMPVYTFPELLNDISPALKKKMQGKSCFNFKKAEPELFGELGVLTQDCFIRIKEQNFV